MREVAICFEASDLLSQKLRTHSGTYQLISDKLIVRAGVTYMSCFELKFDVPMSSTDQGDAKR